MAVEVACVASFVSGVGCLRMLSISDDEGVLVSGSRPVSSDCGATVACDLRDRGHFVFFQESRVRLLLFVRVETFLSISVHSGSLIRMNCKNIITSNSSELITDCAF